MPPQRQHKIRCPYCNASVTSDQGLMSHLRQRPICWSKLEAGRSKGVSEPTASNPAVIDLDNAQQKFLYMEEEPEELSLPGHRVVEVHQTAARVFGQRKTAGEARQEEDQVEGLQPWWPFKSQGEWLLADWLFMSGVSQTAINAHLQLPMTLDQVNPSFRTIRDPLKLIDKLPSGAPFHCKRFQISGDLRNADGTLLTENVEMWCRDPVVCIHELLSNAAFCDATSYAPERVHIIGENSEKIREFSELWTGDWWHEKQDLLPPGATIAPVILASDKTAIYATWAYTTRYKSYAVLWILHRIHQSLPELRGQRVLRIHEQQLQGR